MLDISLFRLPTFRASIVGGTFVRLGVGAGPLLLPLLLQIALQWSPLKAGVVTITMEGLSLTTGTSTANVPVAAVSRIRVAQ